VEYNNIAFKTTVNNWQNIQQIFPLQLRYLNCKLSFFTILYFFLTQVFENNTLQTKIPFKQSNGVFNYNVYLSLLTNELKVT